MTLRRRLAEIERQRFDRALAAFLRTHAAWIGLVDDPARQ